MTAHNTSGTERFEYVDVREFHPNYTSIDCRECDRPLIVSWAFAYTNDEWYHRGCLPERLRGIGSKNHVEVRL